jgi:hypothetical protein
MVQRVQNSVVRRKNSSHCPWAISTCLETPWADFNFTLHRRQGQRGNVGASGCGKAEDNVEKSPTRRINLARSQSINGRESCANQPGWSPLMTLGTVGHATFDDGGDENAIMKWRTHRVCKWKCILKKILLKLNLDNTSYSTKKISREYTKEMIESR